MPPNPLTCWQNVVCQHILWLADKIWYANISSDLLTKCGMPTYPLTCWINVHRKLPINAMQYLHRLPLPKYTPLKILRACLYGPGYPKQPFPRDNFTKRLYENCVTEPQFTLLNYAYILRRNKHRHLPLFLCISSFIKYSCVCTFRKWSNTSIF